MTHSSPSGPRHSVAGARRVPWRVSTLLIALWAAACESPVAPAACGPLPQVTVNVGETSSVAACFNDANGDVLTYTASSSNPAVATASISGTSITVAGVAPGNTTVTVTASDPEGLQGQSSFAVTVPNRAPQPRGTMPNVTVRVDGTATVEASQYFSEPDGEVLTYTAGSSDADVASVSVAGSTITVAAEAKGRATITITASDPGGLSASQSFRLTVPNRPPAAVGVIGAQTIEVGQSVTLDVASSFTDPDGDRLTYTAVSSIAAVARTSVSGSAVTVTAQGPGTTTVTITASDDERAMATQQVSVTVPQPNRAPLAVGSIPAQRIEVGRRATVDASRYFRDPDGDALTYSATSSNASVARASVSGSTVTITGAGAGSATITVTARDPEGLTATQQSRVTVPQPNRAPRPVRSIPAQTIEVGGRATVNASQYFSDPDGDALTYSASSSSLSVARASVSGSMVTITGASAGSATVTVTARDPDGLTATQQVRVTVSQPNRAPETVGSISDRTITAGETSMLNASSYFRDPDGDLLTYTARSSRTSVATVSVAGSQVTVRAVAQGSATVRVTATDLGGLSAEQSFTVTVQSGGGGGTRTYQTGETISTLPTGFWTPDVTSGASFQFSGGQVTITFTSGGYIEEASIRYTCRASGCRIVNRVVTQGTIEASGGGGGGGSNRAPTTVGSISDRMIAVGETLTVNAPSYFRDPDGDRLTYTARSSWTSVATASVSGTQVTVRAVAQGSATVRITATDPGGLSTEQSFSVTVRSAGAPDLVVSLSKSSATVAPGGRVTFRTTIRNQGDATSAATRWRLFQSEDRTITTSDRQIGSAENVASLAPSREEVWNTTITIPAGASDGAKFYVGGCVDAVSGESNTNNNCSSALTITVETGGGSVGADLVVAVSRSSVTVAPGGRFSYDVTVRNQGDATAAATRLRVFASADATISTSDTQVGEAFPVPSLAPSQEASYPHTITVAAGRPPGTFYLGECVDAVSGESNTNNNCSSAITVTVQTGGGGGSDTTYTTGQTIETLPASGCWFPNRSSGISLQCSSGVQTITFTGTSSYIVYNNIRYSCVSTGGCRLGGRQVTRGSIRASRQSGGSLIAEPQWDRLLQATGAEGTVIRLRPDDDLPAARLGVEAVLWIRPGGGGE